MSTPRAPRILVFLVAAGMALLLAGPTPAQQQVTVRVEEIATQLEIPWAIDFAPDGRIFFTERPGRVRVLQNGRVQAEPWATVAVAHVGEGGLLGLALSPDFARTGLLYLYHTYEEGGRLWNRVVRYAERGGRGVQERVVIDRIPGARVHDGGRIRFGPDGKLYVTTGDARTPDLAQDRNALNGKILRLNPDGTIPADNPFPGSPVYSYGHRNPQGLAWHPDTKALFETEHGPSGDLGLCCHDEVNLIEPGRNYGWPHVAGMGSDARFVNPILESGATQTWAPSGAAIPTSGLWRGNLLFAALRGAHLHIVTLAPPSFRTVLRDQVLFRAQFGRLRDVTQGPDGAIYLLTSNRDGRGGVQESDDRIIRLVINP